MPHIQGRAFTRFEQFEALSEDMQREVNALEYHLINIETEVFDKHHPHLIHSTRGVRYKELLQIVDAYLEQDSNHVLAGARPSPFAPTPAPTSTAKAHTSKDKVKLKLKPAGSQASEHAKQLVEGLVLRGFLTLYKEDDKPSRVAETFAFKHNDLFVPVSSIVAGETERITTVWDLVDGALFAGTVKRKTGVLEKLSRRREVYAVVNARGKTLALFESDLSRKPLLQVDAIVDGARVALDTTHFAHGVRVSTSRVCELLDLETQELCEEFVIALRAVGMRYEASSPHGLSPVNDHVRGVSPP